LLLEPSLDDFDSLTINDMPFSFITLCWFFNLPVKLRHYNY